mmetsp:Transcript_122931/g.348428  ORF Transcript_122931/g.348428 Transcript_122931/m.348428 type:complete len:438 (-) Transcript_122931:597-1910(-)
MCETITEQNLPALRAALHNSSAGETKETKARRAPPARAPLRLHIVPVIRRRGVLPSPREQDEGERPQHHAKRGEDCHGGVRVVRCWLRRHGRQVSLRGDPAEERRARRHVGDREGLHVRDQLGRPLRRREHLRHGEVRGADGDDGAVDDAEPSHAVDPEGGVDDGRLRSGAHAAGAPPVVHRRPVLRVLDPAEVRQGAPHLHGLVHSRAAAPQVLGGHGVHGHDGAHVRVLVELDAPPRLRLHGDQHRVRVGAQGPGLALERVLERGRLGRVVQGEELGDGVAAEVHRRLRHDALEGLLHGRAVGDGRAHHPGERGHFGAPRHGREAGRYEVLADRGQVLDNVDARGPQLARVADAGQEEQARGVHEPGGEDHLLPCVEVDVFPRLAPEPERPDTDALAVSYDQPIGAHAVHHGEPLRGAVEVSGVGRDFRAVGPLR